jgi:hypothetical protein
LSERRPAAVFADSVDNRAAAIGALASGIGHFFLVGSVSLIGVIRSVAGFSG